MNSQLLLDKNLAAFGPAIGNERLQQLDWNYIKDKLLEANAEKDFNNWKSSPNKAILLPDLMPRSEDLMNHYLSISKQYEMGSSVDQYYNDHECDPHLFQFLKVAFDAISEVGEDVKCSVTTDQFDVDNLLVVDTGNGQFLNYMLEKYQPKNLIIAVSRWEDFVSSFYVTDWIEVNKRFSKYKEENPHRIGLHLSRVDNSNETLNMLLKHDIVSIDHSVLCFCANSSDKAIQIVEGLNSKTAQNIVNYLGFTQDEFNMVKTSSAKMQNNCKIFSPVPTNVKFSRIVVCASGPSLDRSIPQLKDLMSTHYIVASASCYGTLRDNGIRVDAVVILERGYSVYDDYFSVIQKHGSDNSLLVTSSVSDIRLHSLFEKTITYFRVSLTPFALFSQNHYEHLPYDGPQAVNSAVSFALGFRPQSLMLVGVDLGTRDLTKVRSKGAVGVSPRSLNHQKVANLDKNEVAYTDTYMTDASIILKELANIFGNEVELYNSSDGILIDGFKPLALDLYKQIILKEGSNYSLDDSYNTIHRWFSICRLSTSDDFYATWHRGGQRTSIHKTFGDFRRVLNQREGRLLEDEFYRINQIFSVQKSQREQFASRITRGCIIKLMAALKRQDILFTDKPNVRDEYFTIVRRNVSQLSYKLEKELYMLVSNIEKDFILDTVDLNNARPLS